MRYLFFLSILFFTWNASSHGGDTTSSGCHNNYKTGKYHCHGSEEESSQPSSPEISGSLSNFNEVSELRVPTDSGVKVIRYGDRFESEVACLRYLTWEVESYKQYKETSSDSLVRKIHDRRAKFLEEKCGLGFRRVFERKTIGFRK